MDIHNTAIVHPKAQLREEVKIGPYSIIGEGVTIGDNTRIESHVVIKGNITIGRNCRIYPQVVIGGEPQDFDYRGEETFIIIGDDNIIREGVTIHRASGEGKATKIGDGNFLMAYSHIAHNCQVGNKTIISNLGSLAGYSVVEDRAVIGGLAGVHQFTRIGKLCMIGGLSKVVKDIPPYTMADGHPAKLCGLNIIGLRRAGITSEEREAIKKAFKIWHNSKVNRTQAIELIEKEVPLTAEVEHFLDFLRNSDWIGSRSRGIEK